MHNIEVVFGKSGFAISQVKLPYVHKALVKTTRQYIGAARQKTVAPALKGFGVIVAEGQLVDDFQPRITDCP